MQNLAVFAAIGSLFITPYALTAIFGCLLVAMVVGIGRYLVVGYKESQIQPARDVCPIILAS
ncbi:MAG: hypothetical protein Q7T01_02910 [bacterium]|nr:hypothetical protein [bacterium]